MKHIFCIFFGVLGGILSAIFGGFDNAMITLLVFMAADYITGVALSLVFKKSPKTTTGGYSSGMFVKGAVKKGLSLLIVIVAVRLDTTVGVDYFRDCTVFAICANELLSIIENMGLCGVPIPDIIKKGIDVLNEKIEP